MITLAWYLLKVIICSGILCGYYFLALRNKVFHHWNRFYLLAAVVISLSAPIIKIDIFQNNNDKGTVVQMLQTISYGDEAVIEYSKNNGFQINTQNLAEGIYLLVSMIFLFIFFVSIYKIKKLKKKYPETKIEGISFISTNAKGTPFSFFKSIFWNNAIDLHSKPGQQIFNHEIAHVKEKHTYDKIFMNIVLIFFWINPFFWLLQKELHMIHEFVADKEALEDSDINAFAEMILQTVYPGQNFSLTNKFFYSPIKRRILMLTKNKNPKVSYYSRLLVLPLAAIVFFAFTLKVNSSHAINSYNGKTITVVIDAGHGGADNGAISKDGIKEKDITLSIAQKIADLNSNPHIKILLSRNDNELLSVKDRVAFSKNNNADLFISLHVNAAENKQLNGFSVLIDKENSAKNMLLGSTLIDELKKFYQTEEKIGVRKNGIWVLDKNVCPAALIECGFLSNSSDEAFITDKTNQEKIARNILKGIENYASSLNTDASSVNETLPSKTNDTLSYAMYYKGKKLRSTKYVDNSTKVEAIYSDGSKETITKAEALKRGFIPSPPLDGTKETTNREDAKKAGLVKDSIPKKVYQKVQVEASFPGGPAAWTRYISRAISDSISKFTDADYGTCVIRFIVNTDGRVTDVTATTMEGTELAKVSINAIKKGPKWIPASQNGHNVAAYRLQPVTLTKSDKLKNNSTKSEPTISTSSVRKNISGKIFTKIDQPASFPGRQTSWLKYLARIFEKNGNELIADNNNQGICKVRFIVSKDGKVSDVQPVTMKGTQLADVAVNAIEKGPRWNPGLQNGKAVNSYVLVPVTFKLSDNLLKNEPE